MGKRALAGRDLKIIQGHRRDEFFARMKRRGGVPRMPTQGAPADAEDQADSMLELEAEAQTAADAEAKPAEEHDAEEAQA
jgi:hypothetical protein